MISDDLFRWLKYQMELQRKSKSDGEDEDEDIVNFLLEDANSEMTQQSGCRLSVILFCFFTLVGVGLSMLMVHENVEIPSKLSTLEWFAIVLPLAPLLGLQLTLGVPKGNPNHKCAQAVI